ncbi:MAG: DegT/DnrJ/EryC1/StrS family aminotransferase [Bacteroides sp.]|nr:DegT/DnrJ/EryC1/StrS family aminotransferase [Prevotella sp.]MCM1407106.1 DegT/DnrJ/EryC1/StrS family aminotransferase [Treponema brennaborense]MCM1470258.1 DegT/DnrJ/EryC1/StrS family aminotransferase [Bacteroides sp.]
MKIQTFSSSIRRKEMDAVLTCLVEEKTGPGDMNARLVQQAKEYFAVEGAVALRSPAVALAYIVKALALEKKSGIMISALAPAWQLKTIEELGYEPIVLDVAPETGLVTAAQIQNGMQNGGRLLILHENMGLVPDFEAIAALGIPFVEDISQNAGASVNGKKAGSFGVYAILGLEEHDMATAGGGAVLLAPSRREWIVLKKIAEEAASTDILPDINSALGFVQLKELDRNEAVRQELREMYVRSLMQGKHTSFSRSENALSVAYSFPVVLESSMKDVKQYAARKDIEISAAYENSVIALREELLPDCLQAKSLLLRCVLFPLYPRLGKTNAVKIAKVLATLP